VDGTNRDHAGASGTVGGLRGEGQRQRQHDQRQALSGEYKQCEAQTTVQGCTPIVSLADCKTLCDGLASSTPTTCTDEFDAYYNCSAKDGFACTIGLVAQKTQACMSDQDAFDRCRNGGKKTTCEGALDSGVCPSVQCPCKSGTIPASGFDQSGSSCVCYDAVTCVDFFCD
jgi:hypothetical protein